MFLRQLQRRYSQFNVLTFFNVKCIVYRDILYPRNKRNLDDEIFVKIGQNWTDSMTRKEVWRKVVDKEAIQTTNYYKSQISLPFLNFLSISFQTTYNHWKNLCFNFEYFLFFAWTERIDTIVTFVWFIHYETINSAANQNMAVYMALRVTSYMFMKIWLPLWFKLL